MRCCGIFLPHHGMRGLKAREKSGKLSRRERTYTVKREKKIFQPSTLSNRTTHSYAVKFARLSKISHEPAMRQLLERARKSLRNLIKNWLMIVFLFLFAFFEDARMSVGPRDEKKFRGLAADQKAKNWLKQAGKVSASLEVILEGFSRSFARCCLGFRLMFKQLHEALKKRIRSQSNFSAIEEAKYRRGGSGWSRKHHKKTLKQFSKALRQKLNVRDGNVSCLISLILGSRKDLKRSLLLWLFPSLFMLFFSESSPERMFQSSPSFLSRQSVSKNVHKNRNIPLVLA